MEDIESCKNEMAAITSRPQPNFNENFIFTTDASDKTIGAILSQADSDHGRKIIHIFSKNLDKSQLNYSTTHKELLASVKGINHFKHYLLGRKFTLETDHKPLKYLQMTTHPNRRFIRWSLFLQDFDFDIHYIPG